MDSSKDSKLKFYLRKNEELSLNNLEVSIDYKNVEASVSKLFCKAGIMQPKEVIPVKNVVEKKPSAFEAQLKRFRRVDSSKSSWMLQNLLFSDLLSKEDIERFVKEAIRVDYALKEAKKLNLTIFVSPSYEYKEGILVIPFNASVDQIIHIISDNLQRVLREQEWLIAEAMKL